MPRYAVLVRSLIGFICLGAVAAHASDPIALPKPKPLGVATAKAGPCVNGSVDGFPCRDIDLRSQLDLAALGGSEVFDVWGWTDRRDGREYAIVTMSEATAFVDVSDPDQPALVGRLPVEGGPSATGDVKVYRDRALIVGETETQGIQIFDLRRLANNLGRPPITYTANAHYTEFGEAHNLAINEETGFAYAIGTRRFCHGALNMLDVRNPIAPQFVGCFEAIIDMNDAQCVTYRGPDSFYRGREICFTSDGLGRTGTGEQEAPSVSIIDVTDKAAPRIIARAFYDGQFAHQGWLSDNHELFFLNDELDEADLGQATRTYALDVRDLDAPFLRQTFVHSTTTTDHNLFVVGNFVFEANHTAGLQVLEIVNSVNGRLRRRAFFDIVPEHNGLASDRPEAGEGAFGVYPFFASGNVLVSGTNSGLFVVRPTFDFASGGGGECTLPAGNGRFCTECGPCGVGQGDCDTNAECASGLTCADNVGADFGFAPGIDVCVADGSGGGGDGGGGGGDDACALALGNGRYCMDCGPCTEGQGDCDSDAECASGLTCADNVGASFGFAPGIDVCVASGDGGGGGDGGDGGDCSEPSGSGPFCSVCGPCSAGQGDCDNDAECAAGLSCVDNIGADFGFPAGVDVCVADGTGPSCPFVVGNGRFCSDCGPCAAGQGDCDNDSECASGLVCADNVGADFGFPAAVDVCVVP